MRAKVLELEKKIFDGDVTKIVVPAAGGEMCILPNHISIMTFLKRGTLKIFRPEGERPLTVSVDGGVCSFAENCAVFILNKCEQVPKI